MIKAEKNKIIEFVFAAINRNMLKKHFSAHHLRGFEVLKNLEPSVPKIFYANHSNWWDGLLAFHLSYDILGLDTILMMDIKQLQKYRFFRWIGAFSVDREDRHKAMESLEYALGEIKTGKRVLWIYPQGVMLPNEFRPLTFQQGAAHLAKRLTAAYLIPVVHRYDFLEEQRPQVFTSIGRPMKIHALDGFHSRELTKDLQGTLTHDLDKLKEDMLQQRLKDFEVTIRGERSTNIKYDHFRGQK